KARSLHQGRAVAPAPCPHRHQTHAWLREERSNNSWTRTLSSDARSGEPSFSDGSSGAAWTSISHRTPLGVATPERVMTLVYEAGLRACIAILAKAGYRLRSGEGHHRAALEAAVAVVGDQIEIGISR